MATPESVLSEAERQRRIALGNRNRTHGCTGNPTYLSWRAMLSRCYNKNHAAYGRYGGAGIKVCQRWLEFSNFLNDMGQRPEGLTLERKDGSRGYTPENCLWATRKQQARNMRKNVFISHNGKTQCLTDWSIETGIGVTTLHYRLRHNQDVFNPDISHGKHQRKKTHCPQGHPYDENNTSWLNGHRKCKECNKLRARELRRKERESRQ